METLAVSLGDSCIDHYLPPIEEEFIGGNALNVAIAMQRAGLPCAYVGVVGSDRYGKLIKKTLRKQGVDVSHVQVTAGPTHQANIQLIDGNEHVFIHTQDTHRPRLELDDDTLRFIRQHKLVHTSWLGEAQDYLAEFKQAELRVTIDYGEGHNPTFLEETLGLADLAFFSMPEATEAQARRRAIETARDGPGLVVITRGQEGSLAFHLGEFYTHQASPVQVVDSVGAGDAFIGTFLAEWTMERDLPACLEGAARAAAHACTYLGGWDGAGIKKKHKKNTRIA